MLDCPILLHIFCTAHRCLAASKYISCSFLLVRLGPVLLLKSPQFRRTNPSLSAICFIIIIIIIYTLYMTEDTILMHMSLLRFLLGFRSCPFQWTLLIFKFPLCFTSVLPSTLAPPPDAPLRQIQLVVTEMSSGGKLSHSVRFDF